MPEDLALDWSSATVKDGKLKVQVVGDTPDDWKETFERSVKLLQGGRGDWGEVRVKKHEVRVADVTRGSEENLRHFLEGVIQQVNASAPGDDTNAGDPDEAAADTPDGQMTQRFREFAEERSLETEESSSED